MSNNIEDVTAKAYDQYEQQLRIFNTKTHQIILDTNIQQTTTTRGNMNLPVIRKADELKDWNYFISKNNKKYLARPCTNSSFSLLYRLKLSYLVFIGKYDALEGTEQ